MEEGKRGVWSAHISSLIASPQAPWCWEEALSWCQPQGRSDCPLLLSQTTVSYAGLQPAPQPLSSSLSGSETPPDPRFQQPLGFQPPHPHAGLLEPQVSQSSSNSSISSSNPGTPISTTPFLPRNLEDEPNTGEVKGVKWERDPVTQSGGDTVWA